NEKMPTSENELGKSTSPYLLQHAKNPVHWKEWSTRTLAQAKSQDKPILVSIGYSSCHWCHVMEKESFEDSAVASIMNEYFVNIKVDREERPDVDQIYMDAIQSMGLNGGWPLNVFLTPDQKPFYGGTYFPKEGWKNLLQNVHEAFENKREQLDESADEFAANLQRKESEKYKLNGDSFQLNGEQKISMFQSLAARFDTVHGGFDKAPKFPMPTVWQYLSAYASLNKNEEALKHVEKSLDAIANGGIYDHVGGGFARYSVDGEWHVPHYEKMLYDNGQLLSLYATGYKITRKELYKKAMLETATWLKREMLDSSGGFYSALDADSEGIEGKFYVWSETAIKELAGADFPVVKQAYDVSNEGNWEGTNVLRRKVAEQRLLSDFSLNENSLQLILENFKEKALFEREKRERPGLDNKIIAGWNGLTLTGLCDAYQATEEPFLLRLAKDNAQYIRSELIEANRLKRFANCSDEAFLEDYAAVIQGFIKYYETTLESVYLEHANKLILRANAVFFDEEEGFYFFTSDDAEQLIARKKEIFDNVIPSSNSLMAWNLLHVGTHFYDEDLLNQGKSMLAKVADLFRQEPEYMSQWALTALEFSEKFAEIIIVGPDAKKLGAKINREYLPNKIIAGSTKESDLTPFQHKTTMEGKTTIYVCYDKVCQRPVTNVAAALQMIQ
ncbi:MAG: thioredoxin domain-containing protein, partial [Bacteroidota bacterium]